MNVSFTALGHFNVYTVYSVSRICISHFVGNHLSNAVEPNKEEVEMGMTANQVIRIIIDFLIVTRERERERACIFSRLQ